MKILYISQYFPPEMGAPAARVSELSQLWARDGHNVTVLTGFPNHPTGMLAQDYRAKFCRLVIREQLGGVRAIRTWLLPLPNRKAWERILNYASFCLSAAITGMFLNRPDVVIATSPQLLVGLAGWWLARCKRVPFIFEVRDLWPESLAAVGSGEERSPLYRALARIAGFLYRAADRIVVVTPAFKEHLVRNWRVAAEKITVVENGVDRELFHPHHDAREIRKLMRAEGKIVFAYIGTIGMAHGLEALLEAALRLQAIAPDIVFWIVGEGAEKRRIVERSRSLRLTNVHFIGQQPREEIPKYICASDACLVLLKKADLFKTVLPTKMLEFMSCRRPVIAAMDGYARDILGNADAGLAVDPENPSDLTNALLRMARDPSLRQRLGCNGRNFILQYFSRERSARTYLRLLEELLDLRADYSTAAA